MCCQDVCRFKDNSWDFKKSKGEVKKKKKEKRKDKNKTWHLDDHDGGLECKPTASRTLCREMGG